MIERNYVIRAMMVAAVGATMALSGCNNTDPLPAPVSGFEVITPLPEVGIPIKFSNLSTNSATYVWDFGDTTATVTNIAPEHTYAHAGTYTVSLTSTTQDNQTSTETKEITIGQRYLIAVDILGIPYKNPDGNAWHDDGSNPDLMLFYGPTNSPSDPTGRYYFSPIVRNIGISDTTKLPFYIGLQNNEVIPITNEDYDLYLLDFHGIPDSEVDNTDFNTVLIFGVSFNAITDLPRNIISEQDGVGFFKILIDNGDYMFELYFGIQ